MTRRTQEKIRKLFPYISVLIIGVLIVLGVWLFAEKTEPSPVPQPSTQEQTPPPSSTEKETETPATTTEAPETEPELPTANAIDAVNVDRLIGRYYAAKLKDDADELNLIVEGDRPYDVASLSNETQFISKYDNFLTYVIPGISDNNFIVYVKYDIFFNGIKTGAPALNHFVCVKDGVEYRIYNKDISSEFAAYLNDTENSDTVLRLKQQVEDELAAACAADEDLKYLMELLNGPDSSGS
ncbi:MAG: hypothetical protein IJM50_04845 [Lachnospiraceae bacterium]|nr:hypothetical protein [Lachnospiraceae bacterium]